MSELSLARKSSDLAIVERKPHIHRPGGCVGVFFQLFDWNRRFSKKKFFPKKLLPPARAKVSKKFNADEKLPVTKHLLIADENSGGFPIKMKKKNGDYKMGLESKKSDMKAPGLVARLMGLEAMPVVVNESEKSFSVDDNKGKGEHFGNELKNVELSPEKVIVRPHKLQKTSVAERSLVTRFGVEAFQIKNLLSRSRNHHFHHPKILSTVKSPKMGRNASRLIDVASRILEPGVQATNRARCSLIYSSSSTREPCTEDVKGRLELDFKSNSHEVPASTEEHDCRTCGNVFGRLDDSVRPVSEEQLRNLDRRGYNVWEGRGLKERRVGPIFHLENENDVGLLKTRYQHEDSKQVQNELIWNDVRPSYVYDQIPVSKIFTSQKDTSRSTTYNSRSQRPGKMLVGDSVPPKSKSANSRDRRVPVSSPLVNVVVEAKDFIALNRNINRSRVRAPCKIDSFKGGRMFQTGKNDSLQSQRNPIRKRMTIPANIKADRSASGSSSVEKRKLIINQGCPKTRSVSQRRNKDSIPTDVVSFTFNSPVKCNRGRNSHNALGSSEQPSENYLGINGDAVGALLEQKLKELTNQVENEAITGFKPSARTTASILQELISALTNDQSISSEGRNHSADRKDPECDHIFDKISQANSRSKRGFDGFPHGVDLFSPGCVLDASFSNESCISSSIDDNSVKLNLDDASLSDSAFSTNPTRSSNVMVVTDLVTHTSSVLEDVNCVHAKLTATQRDYMQGIVLNAELLFGNAASLHSSSRFIDFLLGPFLDELETLVIAAWKNSIILGIEVKKEENPLRRFLLDCLIECLDIKYSRFINSGFRTWSKLLKTIKAEVLIKEFDEEVRKWISFAGKTPDEIIEREMGSSLGKWTDFELEVFENGIELNHDIVQSLVDEIVTDLYASELSFHLSPETICHMYKSVN